jgi:hypothetical protein
MSETDRIEQKYGNLSEMIIMPTKKTLVDLARRDSKFNASEEYFKLIEERRYSPDKIPQNYYG